MLVGCSWIWTYNVKIHEKLGTKCFTRYMRPRGFIHNAICAKCTNRTSITQMVTFYMSNRPAHNMHVRHSQLPRCPSCRMLMGFPHCTYLCNHGDSCQNKQNKMVENMRTHNRLTPHMHSFKNIRTLLMSYESPNANATSSVANACGLQTIVKH